MFCVCVYICESASFVCVCVTMGVWCVCGLCVHALRINEKVALMVDLTDFQLLLYDQSHGLQQTFPRAGDGLHSQAKVRLGPS